MTQIEDLSVLRELIEYNPETGLMFWRPRNRKFFGSDGAHRSWNSRCAGKQAFCTRHPGGYYMGSVFHKGYLAHRVAWAIVNGSWPDEQIDHINGDRTDNRMANLRAVSPGENGKNKAMLRTNSSGHIGVSWNKRKAMWRARIVLKGRDKALGHYHKFEDAVAARREAQKAHGFSARHGNLTAFRAATGEA